MRCSLFKWLPQKCTVSLQQDEIQFASTAGDCLLLMGDQADGNTLQYLDPQCPICSSPLFVLVIYWNRGALSFHTTMQLGPESLISTDVGWVILFTNTSIRHADIVFSGMQLLGN